MQSAMEQSRYWMWTRRKLSGRPLVESPTLPKVASSYNDSWEEQAFAEDSAGRLGGCIWPPRSYSCSFCRREFRSAQALGGHMNVHRRDRARLKQSPTPHSENIHHHPHQQQHQINPYTVLASQSSPQVCSLVYNNHKPNPNPNPNHGVGASPLSPSRVSAVSAKENCSEQSFLSSSYTSSIVHEQHKATLFSTPRSISDSFPIRILNDPELKLGRENSKPSEMGFNFAGEGEEEVVEISCKRRRTDAPLPFILGSTLGDRRHHRSEVPGLSPSPNEELDLELRL